MFVRILRPGKSINISSVLGYENKSLKVVLN